MYSIKTLFLATTVVALSSCGNNSSHIIPPIIAAKKDTVKVKELISGERINGPANIRDSINGEVIFSLYEKTLVTCTEQRNGWYEVGLTMDLAKDEFGMDTLRKGRKILLDGKEVGVILKDIVISTMQTNTQILGELTGYTHSNNIYSYSIIENALTDYLSRDANKTIASMQPFIKDFEMGDGDSTWKPFVMFMSYENWVDDPSPLMRIVLIFTNSHLIGAVHSRPISIPNTTDYKLEREFHAFIFNDVDKALKDRFIKDFNGYINTVD